MPARRWRCGGVRAARVARCGVPGCAAHSSAGVRGVAEAEERVEDEPLMRIQNRTDGRRGRRLVRHQGLRALALELHDDEQQRKESDSSLVSMVQQLPPPPRSRAAPSHLTRARPSSRALLDVVLREQALEPGVGVGAHPPALVDLVDVRDELALGEGCGRGRGAAGRARERGRRGGRGELVSLTLETRRGARQGRGGREGNEPERERR